MLVRVKKEVEFLGPDGKIGFIKVVGKGAITISPHSEKLIKVGTGCLQE